MVRHFDPPWYGRTVAHSRSTGQWLTIRPDPRL